MTVDADDDRALIDEQIADLGARVDLLREAIIALVEAGADTKQQSQLLFNMVGTIRYLKAVRTEIPMGLASRNAAPLSGGCIVSSYVN